MRSSVIHCPVSYAQCVIMSIIRGVHDSSASLQSDQTVCSARPAAVFEPRVRLSRTIYQGVGHIELARRQASGVAVVVSAMNDRL
jgi:hypothetical protein